MLGSHPSTSVRVLWLRRILCTVLLMTGARMLWAQALGRDGACPVSLRGDCSRAGGRRGKPRLYGKVTTFNGALMSSSSNSQELLERIHAALEAARAVLNRFTPGAIETGNKVAHDPVTEAHRPYDHLPPKPLRA